MTRKVEDQITQSIHTVSETSYQAGAADERVAIVRHIYGRLKKLEGGAAEVSEEDSLLCLADFIVSRFDTPVV